MFALVIPMIPPPSGAMPAALRFLQSADAASARIAVWDPLL
jgi:hypothetical protein